jgi:hypothetical protein
MAANGMHGAFVWHEMNTSDSKKVKSFYTQLLGWGSKDMDMGPSGTYTVFTKDGADHGGLAQMTGPQWKGVSPHWLTYIGVDDVDKATAKVKKLGGTVKMEAIDIPVGRFAVVADPAGAVFGLFKGSGQGM